MCLLFDTITFQTFRGSSLNTVLIFTKIILLAIFYSDSTTKYRVGDRNGQKHQYQNYISKFHILDAKTPSRDW